MTAQRPNVLVVLTGQQTADAMGAAGNPYLSTPHMDALAAAGTRYRRAYCGQPLCAPSRTGLLTGRLPSASGAADAAGATGTAADGAAGATADGAASEPPLGRVFAEAGYDCVYTGSWHLPEHEAPDGRGFRRLHPTGTEGTDGIDGADAGFTRTVTGFLTRPRSRPFLLLLPLPEPHGISAWARGQDPSTGPLPAPPPAALCPPLPANHPRAPYEAGLPRLAQRARPHTHPTAEWREDDWRRYRHAYYTLVERADQQLGTVLAAVREHRRWSGRETVVVFTSDHGDGAGAHGWNEKWALFEEVVRVPFLIGGPGVAAGEVSDRLLSVGEDLLPTLCDLTGVPLPPDLAGPTGPEGPTDRVGPAGPTPSPSPSAGHQPEPQLRPGLPGRSVLAPEPRETVVVETRWELPGFEDALGRMIRDERHKYVCYAWGEHREQLFDLTEDPGEMVNLAADARNAALLDRFRTLLAEHCAGAGDPFGRFVPVRDTLAPQPQPAPAPNRV
ncbi:sulfatase [Kitasatospora purpeofusca]|uniref:sulfatase family protein n=1 Tax=Kitasatospora purpeofusca TaxID=67352 RepID=UPI003867396B|nr:sulfatase-like hydrolase/transferase [Kitasatospora purpeofusca]